MVHADDARSAWPGGPRMARILDAVRRNPEGLTTEEVTHLVNAEAHDGDDPKLMS